MTKNPKSQEVDNIATRLWETADFLRANSNLNAGEYSTPATGLIFLKYADNRFAEAEVELAGMGMGR